MLVPRLLALPLLLLLSAPWVASQAPTAVEGVVFLDTNGNGRRDGGEAGLAGVAVSNQIDVVATGADGHYRLPTPGTGVAFVSTPEGFRAASFWTRPENGRADFGLQPRPVATTFTFIHASDPHVSAASLPRLLRLLDMAAERKPAFVIVTGDLVQDALRVPEAEARGYYDLYVDAIGRFPMPVWSVPGNHENFGIERHRSLVSSAHPLYGKGMYRQRLGPNYYSFTWGGVHFVGLDSVDIEDLWYYGHVDAAQLAWLEADLAQVRPGTPVVTFNHIPFVTAGEAVGGYQEEGNAPSLVRVQGRLQYRHVVSNLSEVVPLLAPYRWTLALAGHLHRAEQIRFQSAVATRFHQTAAIVGPNGGTVPAISGVHVYQVRDGVVDDGTFVPLP